MADEFEWHTEVDSGWEPPTPQPEQPKRRLSRRGRLGLLAVASCLLLIAALGVYKSLSGRVEEATGTAESGLLLAHELLVSGALDADSDLVASVVAERPSSWHDLNLDLVSRRLFFGRRPLGIEEIRDSSGPVLASTDIRLSPELDAAEIVDRRPYTVLLSGGMTGTVTLERIFFYERSGDKWQLAPPPDERAFWGNWVTVERQNITMTYRERDEAVALKLSLYLNEFLPALCAAEELACPDDFHLVLKLESDPASIWRLGEGYFAIRASSAATDDRLALPTPTLVGSPVDETAYLALKQGYAGWIGAAIIAGYGASDSDEGAVLAHFGLRPPPAPIRALPRPARPTYPMAIAGPNQDVLMLCSEVSTDRLLRFETASGHWREEPTDGLWEQSDSGLSDQLPGSRSYLSRLPDYQGAIIETVSGDADDVVWRSYLWRPGSIQPLTESPAAHYYLPPRLQPSDQPSSTLAFYVPDAEDDEQFSSLIVTLDQCASSGCVGQSLPMMPIWSPQGTRTALLAPRIEGQRTMYLGDASGTSLAQIEPGQSLAWLDEDHFVYLPLGQEEQQDSFGRWLAQRAVLVSIEGTQPPTVSSQLLFDAEMVRQAMPASIRPETLRLWTVQPASDDGWWYVAASGDIGGDQVDYVVVYSQTAGEARLAAPMAGYRLVEPPMASPTGQQAIAVGLSDDGSKISVELIDATAAEIRRLADLAPMDWSADGNWLIQIDREVLYLTSTTSDAQWTIQHDLAGCYWAVWTEPYGDESDR